MGEVYVEFGSGFDEFGLNLGWVWVWFGLGLGWVWVGFGLGLGLGWVGFGLGWLTFELHLC